MDWDFIGLMVCRWSLQVKVSATSTVCNNGLKGNTGIIYSHWFILTYIYIRSSDRSMFVTHKLISEEKGKLVYSVTVNETWNASIEEFLTRVTTYTKTTLWNCSISHALEVLMHIHSQKLCSYCGDGSMATTYDKICSMLLSNKLFLQNMMQKQGHWQPLVWKVIGW